MLEQDWYKNTIGALYSQIKTKSKPALMYNVLFIARRIAFSGSALLLGRYPFFQIQLLMLQSIVMIQYLVLIRPFMNKVLNITEIFNEICIIIASYHLFIFTDF